mgnify:CR=1 FL=1
MLKFFFKTTAYYIIWKKFKSQIILFVVSIFLIGLIGSIYDDLFKVLKVTNKESVGILLFIKWFLISLIVVYNLYTFRTTTIESKDEIMTKMKESDSSIFPKKSQEVLKKEKILSSTDYILKKYEKKS